MKKFFAEALRLTPNSYEFHELAIIIEIDSEIKCAYHFKRKLENSGYDLSFINNQGYDLDEIKDNPQDTFQIYNTLSRLLTQYVNKSLPTDNFVLYTWDTIDTAMSVSNFLYDNGSWDVDQYFLPTIVNIPSILVDASKGPIRKVELKELMSNIYSESVDKDAMSRLVAIYKLYKYATT